MTLFDYCDFYLIIEVYVYILCALKYGRVVFAYLSYCMPFCKTDVIESLIPNTFYMKVDTTVIYLYH